MLVGEDGLLDVSQRKMPWLRSGLGSVKFIVNLINNDEKLEEDFAMDSMDRADQKFQDELDFIDFTQTQINDFNECPLPLTDFTEEKETDTIQDGFSFCMDNALNRILGMIIWLIWKAIVY